MGLNSEIHGGSHIALLPATTITTAVTGTTTTPVTRLAGMSYLMVKALFTYGSGGTTVKAWIQTSFDGGTTWVDVMNFAFTTASGDKVSAACIFIAPATQAATPTDGTLADNTINQGTLGDRIRVKYTTTGTYAGGSSLKLDAVAKA